MLHVVFMESDAATIIRTLRHALEMSQAEFARSLGWGTSTISRWESGKAQPNRLAMKIILAFAEERGVRYRPRAKTMLPVPVAPDALHPEAMHHAVPMVAVPVRHPEPVTWSTSASAERPAWEAQLSFRVAVDRNGSTGRGARLTRAIAGGALCTSAILGIALMTATPARTGHDAAAPRSAGRVSVGEQLAAVPSMLDVPRTRGTSRRGRRRHAEEAPLPEAPAAAAVPAPPPAPRALARLEGVTLLGSTRKATFRTDADAISLSEGEQLGSHHAERVGVDGVDLRDATGAVHTVKLGDTIPLE